MGGQPSTRRKPSIARQFFTRGKPTWLQNQQSLGKDTHAITSISTTIVLYHAQPFASVSNPLQGQPNLEGIPPQKKFLINT